jgi:hypothetical protein
MKQLLFAILLLLWPWSAAFAQTRPLTLTGSIIVSDDTIPYKVVLTESNGEVKGYSLTYNDPYETKTKIKGALERRNHTFSFKETEIVYIHGYHSGPSLCLIDASLEEVHGSRGYILRGRISSTESDNTACGTGRLVFNDPAEVEELFSAHEKFDTVISMKRRVRDTSTAHTMAADAAAPLVTEKVSSGEEKSLEWHSDTAVIDVWDGGNVDGDRITLSFNGKTWLSSYALIKEKKQLRIPLSGNKTDVVIIRADNEGSDPPNTASLLFTDGTKKYSVLAYNKKGQEVIIKLRRVK